MGGKRGVFITGASSCLGRFAFSFGGPSAGAEFALEAIARAQSQAAKLLALFGWE